MGVVFDANVIVSAVISGRGTPGKLLKLWEEGAFDLIISPAILTEIDRVMHYPKLQQRYNLTDDFIDSFLSSLRELAVMVEPSQEIDLIHKDPSDNRYLECAVEGEATYLVTGDHHLLEGREYKGIAIILPAVFIALIGLGE